MRAAKIAICSTEIVTNRECSTEEVRATRGEHKQLLPPAHLCLLQFDAFPFFRKIFSLVGILKGSTAHQVSFFAALLWVTTTITFPDQ